jgi:hypothetical protein
MGQGEPWKRGILRTYGCEFGIFDAGEFVAVYAAGKWPDFEKFLKRLPGVRSFGQKNVKSSLGSELFTCTKTNKNQ